MDRTLLESYLAQGLSLAEIGRRVGRRESTVGYWLQKHALQAVHHRKHAARGGLSREELEALVQAGASIAQMAAAVGRSKATVRHWLARYALKTHRRQGTPSPPSSQHPAGKRAELIVLACPRHGETRFVSDSRGSYRCRRCRSDAVSRRRRRVKTILVDEAGGCCLICGYHRSMRALHFHHLDPAHKRLAINAQGAALALETLREEARKCVLLCSNCHAEVEDGMVTLPLD